jgi:hypothetical protein
MSTAAGQIDLTTFVLLVGSGVGLLLIVRVGIYYGCLMVVKVGFGLAFWLATGLFACDWFICSNDWRVC